MIKNIVAKSLMLTALVSVNAFAVTIINTNSKDVTYEIKDGYTCQLEYSKGRLSSGGQVVWTQNNLYHPSKVCVHAAGLTSTTGEWAGNINNDSCVLKVVNAGFMKGIKIEKVSGC